ncbi:hypothetical protein ACYCSE_17135 [Paenibacillus sp. SEL1]
MENKTREKEKFPEKKDLMYWIIILIMAMVTVIIWRVDAPKTLTDQITLGASLFSILLAVVGIIIPYIQGNETSRQNLELVNKVGDLSEKIVSLHSLINKQKVLNDKVEEINSKSTQVPSSNEGWVIWKEEKQDIDKEIERLNNELIGSITVTRKS